MIIAGGGTGGHLFPAIAIAEEMMMRDEETKLLFIGTKNGIESRILPEEGWPVKFISAEGIKGRGPMALFRGIIKMIYGIVQSFGIIKSFKPSYVLGVGGYVSVPALIAARLLGINTAIHEQNSRPGLANRLLGKISKKVFLSYSEGSTFFSSEKVMITGNPVRKKILKVFNAIEKSGSRGENFTLLVFGGSQGARSINEVIPEAINESEFRLNKGFKIIHQTGSDDFEKVKNVYGKMGIKADVHSFIKDMAKVYIEADLVICRAGATTISELLAAGKPSILIPYPSAADDHQSLNARVIVKGGGAKMIGENDLNAPLLAAELKDLFMNRSQLDEMAEKAKIMSKPEASLTICDEIEKAVNGKNEN